uniref:Uncharacterized protein n=1 Tax=viral metagenome TaxID=1070528 RepID=A0A6C0KD84_9ZZZZ
MNIPNISLTAVMLSEDSIYDSNSYSGRRFQAKELIKSIIRLMSNVEYYRTKRVLSFSSKKLLKEKIRKIREDNKSFSYLSKDEYAKVLDTLQKIKVICDELSNKFLVHDFYERPYDYQKYKRDIDGSWVTERDFRFVEDEDE